MDKVTDDINPYTHRPLPTRVRQRDIKVTAAQLRWYINQYCPNGDQKVALLRMAEEVEEKACELTGTLLDVGWGWIREEEQNANGDNSSSCVGTGDLVAHDRGEEG